MGRKKIRTIDEPFKVVCPKCSDVRWYTQMSEGLLSNSRKMVRCNYCNKPFRPFSNRYEEKK